MICIYKIQSPSGRIYIGQTVDWQRRKKEYEKSLARYQPKLHRSFKKYGVRSHSFEVIQECKIEELDALEIYYIELYSSVELGLNSKGGGANGRMPQDVRDKISKAHTGKIVSELTKEKLRSYVGNKNPRFGTRHLLCTKYKMKLKASKRIHTKETRDKLSAMQRAYSPNAKIVIDINSGVFYDSPRVVSELYGYNLTTFRCYLNGSLPNKTRYRYA